MASRQAPRMRLHGAVLGERPKETKATGVEVTLETLA
jgi:hypothetical protein